MPVQGCTLPSYFSSPFLTNPPFKSSIISNLNKKISYFFFLALIPSSVIQIFLPAGCNVVGDLEQQIVFGFALKTSTVPVRNTQNSVVPSICLIFQEFLVIVKLKPLIYNILRRNGKFRILCILDRAPS